MNRFGPCASGIALTIGSIVASACSPEASQAGPGQESGPCVDDECTVGLVCRDEVCIDSALAGEEDDGPDPVPDPGGFASVSVLVVVDDTATMGDEQARLAAALIPFVDALAAAEVDWRIGITTTDDANPRCASFPESGRLVVTSCRSRLEEFGPDAATACEAACPEAWPTIATEPSRTDDDPIATVRPWLQSIGGETNLPPQLTWAEALSCLVPQGTTGCEYGEPLESMYKTLTRAESPDDPAAGFVPDDALLAVIIATDAGDCSYNKVHDTVFDPDGTRIFWSDPEASAPTPAVCWNAGVVCFTENCRSADFDPEGNLVAPDQAEADAVLRPVPRYVERLAAREGTLVTLLAGVAPDGSVAYEPGNDTEFELQFGVAPGCEGTSGPAVPPLRLREVADAFAPPGASFVASICDESYTPALASLAAAILERLS